MWNRPAYVCAIFIVGFAAVVLAGPRPQGKALLDANSNKLEVLSQVFERSGYLPQDATNAAVWCWKNFNEEKQDEFVFPEETAKKVPVLLDPQSNPYLLLVDAFQESGWTAEESVEHAKTCFYDGHAAEGGIASNCVVHRIRINYCSGGQEHVIYSYVSTPCYDSIFTASCIASYSCDPGVAWLSLTPSGDCDISIPGSCVAAYFTPATVTVDCIFVNGHSVDCNCFEETETGSMDCSAIELNCCPLQDDACSGCPHCGS